MAKRTRHQRAQKLGSPSSAAIMAVCPFYHGARGRSVICESPIPTSALAYIIFPVQRDLVEHMRLFCCDGYQTCEIYMAVMASKYPEE